MLMNSQEFLPNISKTKRNKLLLVPFLVYLESITLSLVNLSPLAVSNN